MVNLRLLPCVLLLSSCVQIPMTSPDASNEMARRRDTGNSQTTPLFADDAFAPVIDVSLPETSPDVLLVDVAPGPEASMTDAVAMEGSADAPAEATAPDVMITCGTCADYATPRSSGSVMRPELNEPSGLAASRRVPGVLYAQNDSGDIARFFAFSDRGDSIGDFRLAGSAANTDWEDIDVGPCAAGSCIYLGDIGDNRLNRTEYQIYRTPEPDIMLGRSVGTVMVPHERFPFVYPSNTSYNSEAMFVHPMSGDVFIVTKEFDGRSKVFRYAAPLRPDVRVTLQMVGEVVIPTDTGSMVQVTGASMHPCASRILLRTYDRLLEYRGMPGASVQDMFATTPVLVPVGMENKGEAVTYRVDGRGYFTISEGLMELINANECR